MDNVSLLKSLYEALGRGDVPAVLGMMSPEIKWSQAEGHPYRPSGEPWIGPDAVLENLLMKLATQWDGFTIHPKVFHDAGDSVIAEVRYTGTYKATGKNMDTQACHIWGVQDGRFASFQQYTDTAKFQDAMGIR